MRYHEIASGVRLPVYYEDDEILSIFPKSGLMLKSEITDERHEEIARLMVSRGLLRQIVKDGRIYYRINSATDIWKDR